LAALATLPDSRMVARFNGARLAYMADATAWPAFGRGWAKRIASNLLEA
jgi:lysozyme family protein